MNSASCKVEFGNRKAKIYDANGELIGIGDQTRGNLFYLDVNDVTCLLYNLMMCGYDTKYYVMLILIIWSVSVR